LAKSRLLHSARDASDGGVFISIAKAGFPNNIGFEYGLAAGEGDPSSGGWAEVIWGDLASTVVLSCVPSNTQAVLDIARKHGATAFYPIGKTVSNLFKVNNQIDTTISDLKQS